MLSNIPSNVMKALNSDPSKDMTVSFGNTKIVYLSHHESHIASAIFIAPFSKCDFLTIDGHGEKESCVFGYYNGKNSAKKIYFLSSFRGTFIWNIYRLLRF